MPSNMRSAAAASGAHLLKGGNQAFREVPGLLQLAHRQLLIAQALRHPAQTLRKMRRTKCLPYLHADSKQMRLKPGMDLQPVSDSQHRSALQ